MAAIGRLSKIQKPNLWQEMVYNFRPLVYALYFLYMLFAVLCVYFLKPISWREMPFDFRILFMLVFYTSFSPFYVYFQDVLYSLQEKLAISCMEHFALVLQDMKNPAPGNILLLHQDDSLAEVRMSSTLIIPPKTHAFILTFLFIM